MHPFRFSAFWFWNVHGPHLRQFNWGTEYIQRLRFYFQKEDFCLKKLENYLSNKLSEKKSQYGAKNSMCRLNLE